jgi:prevent-host-death family protein
MKQISVGVRELKGQLSRYLRQVKTGATVVITERGTPIGRLVPVASSLEQRLEELRIARQILWSGRRLVPSLPSARLLSSKTVSEILLEDRCPPAT